MSIDLSCVILAKNEEKNISRAIASVKFSDEVIVIDDQSSDKTRPIAKAAGVAVYERSLAGAFAAQRNFALEKARGEWILFVDADEVVTDALKREILNTTTQTEGKAELISAYYIKRRDVFWGREVRFGETGNLKLIRLVARNSGRWVGRVHETFQTTGKTAILKNYLIHRPHLTIKDFLTEINRYSSIRAEELSNQNKKTNIFEIIFYPLAKFILNYFIRLGFLDGAQGFVYAFMMSFHSFLVRSKLYILQDKT